jgi:hypothetical protein
MKKDIDNLLKQWDAQSRPGELAPDEMASKIKQSIDNTPVIINDQESPQRTVHINWIYAAAAAILILTATIGVLVQQLHSVKHFPEFQGIRKSELAELKKINNELRLLFPDSLNSFCIVNGAISINTGNGTADPDEDAGKQQLLVRYSVMQKQHDKWVTVARNDIVTQVGRNVQLSDNGKTPKGYIWSWPADKNVIALESDINISVGKHKFPIKFFGGQRLNVPNKLKETANVKIYQTVTLI